MLQTTSMLFYDNIQFFSNRQQTLKFLRFGYYSNESSSWHLLLMLQLIVLLVSPTGVMLLH